MLELISKMTYLNNFFIKFLFLSLLLALNHCGDSTPREMTKGHMDAVKEQCKNEPDIKTLWKRSKN